MAFGKIGGAIKKGLGGALGGAAGGPWGAAIGIGGAALGLYQAHKAGQDAKDAAKAAARTERRVTTEQLRQLGRDRDMALGDLRATGGASGIDVTASGTSFAELEQDMAREFGLEMGFVSEVGASAARGVERQGKTAARTMMNQSIMDALGFMGTLFR